MKINEMSAKKTLENIIEIQRNINRNSLDNLWKSMQIIDNLWKSYEIQEDQWTSMKIKETHWKSMKLIENHSKSLRINEINANHWKTIKITGFQSGERLVGMVLNRAGAQALSARRSSGLALVKTSLPSCHAAKKPRWHVAKASRIPCFLAHLRAQLWPL